MNDYIKLWVAKVIVDIAFPVLLIVVAILCIVIFYIGNAVWLRISMPYRQRYKELKHAVFRLLSTTSCPIRRINHIVIYNCSMDRKRLPYEEEMIQHILNKGVKEKRIWVENDEYTLAAYTK